MLTLGLVISLAIIRGIIESDLKSVVIICYVN